MHRERQRRRKEHRLQMRDFSLNLMGFQINCYSEVDLSRPFSYNELPEEDHKILKINKSYIFIRSKTRISEFFYTK